MMCNFVIACVLKLGGFYTVHHVRVLSNALRIEGKYSGRIVCLTDADSLPGCDCELVPLKHNLSGWWSKLELFRPGVFDSRVLYLDLDVVVIGPVFGLVEAVFQAAGPLALLDVTPDSREKNYFSSSIMGFAPEWGAPVWSEFERQGHEAAIKDQLRHGIGPGQKGDQGWLRRFWRPTYFQDIMPRGFIIEGPHFKRFGIAHPESARVINYCGGPRIHQRRNDYLNNYWDSHVGVRACIV